jgi:hypothetical protein
MMMGGGEREKKLAYHYPPNNPPGALNLRVARVPILLCHDLQQLTLQGVRGRSGSSEFLTALLADDEPLKSSMSNERYCTFSVRSAPRLNSMRK